MTRQELEIERQKLSKMTSREKISYISSYYHTQIIIACVVLFLICQAFGILYRFTQEDLLYCMFVNERDMTGTQTDRLTADFRSYAGITGKKQVTTFDISLDLDDDSYAQASLIKLTSLHATGTMDTIVAPTDLIDQFNGQDFCLDLTDVLPGALSDALSDRMYYMTDDKGRQIPVAIRLEDSYLSQIVPLEKGSCLAVTTMENSPETVLAFIRYCFGM